MKKNTDSLGDRMKKFYEVRATHYLTRRIPIICRLDGKAFHTLTRKMDKPFDKNFMLCMTETAKILCNKIDGAKLAYVQSDEISILITDYDSLNTAAWFDYNIQKWSSVTAAIASVTFTQLINKDAYFDSRVFNIPKEDVSNYFLWRQKDWIRNSVQMLARTHFSQKELHKKNISDIHEMLHTKGINWAKLTYDCKNGTFIRYNDNLKWYTDSTMILNKDSEIIEQVLVPNEKEEQ